MFPLPPWFPCLCVAVKCGLNDFWCLIKHLKPSFIANFFQWNSRCTANYHQQWFFWGFPHRNRSIMHKINFGFPLCHKHFRLYLIFVSSVFEKIRTYFGAQSESIPMSFVLGFYVSLVVKRWWEQYKLLPWPDTLALFISAAIPGNVSFLKDYLYFKCHNRMFGY